jgi:thiamine-phosphate pyrophosphorylase
MRAHRDFGIMTFALPPVYPITPEDLRGRALLDWADELTGAGATILQLRRKSGPDDERLEELRALLSIARPRGCAVIVDDRTDLCLIAGADGVHLGQEDLPATEARKLLGPQAILGLSTHNLAQAEEAWKLPLDYLALGPVFPTGTKENPDPQVPAHVQTAVTGRSPLPVVAIGGVTPERAPELYARGFRSVAVVSALRRDPAATFRRFAGLRP